MCVFCRKILLSLQRTDVSFAQVKTKMWTKRKMKVDYHPSTQKEANKQECVPLQQEEEKRNPHLHWKCEAGIVTASHWGFSCANFSLGPNSAHYYFISVSEKVPRTSQHLHPCGRFTIQPPPHPHAATITIPEPFPLKALILRSCFTAGGPGRWRRRRRRSQSASEIRWEEPQEDLSRYTNTNISVSLH